MPSRQSKKFGDLYRAVTGDIYAFARAIGYKPTHQHRQLFDAVQRGINGTGIRRIAVKSGQGPGKTKCSGVIGGFLMLRDPWSKVVVTAPTMRQCKDVWHAELKLTLRDADPQIKRLFNFTNTGIGMLGQKPADWGCMLMTATKSENAQGQHRKDMHLIVEEASGVSRDIIEQYKGTLSNPNAFFIQIGNPNTRDCDFFDCFTTMRDSWECITWNAEDTPASEWFDPQRNEDLAAEFGRNSDVYRIRVLGEFPHADPNCIMSSEDVQRIMYGGSGGADTRHMLACARMNPAVRQFGIDVARFGGDECVVFRRSGNAIIEKWWMSRVEPAAAVRKSFVMQEHADWSNDETTYVVDAGGMGQGIMHLFHEARKSVIGFQSHHTSPSSNFANRISHAYFHLGKLVSDRKVAIPFDHILLRQLSTRQYFTDNKGRIIIEKKDDYIRRGHDSPDRADAAVMAMLDAGKVSGKIARRKAPPKVGGRVAASVPRVGRSW